MIMYNISGSLTMGANYLNPLVNISSDQLPNGFITSYQLTNGFIIFDPITNGSILFWHIY